jgi:hypothetical protein
VYYRGRPHRSTCLDVNNCAVEHDRFDEHNGHYSGDDNRYDHGDDHDYNGHYSGDDNGYNNSHYSGYNNGHYSVYDHGYNNGYNNGHYSGDDNGYNNGYNNCHYSGDDNGHDHDHGHYYSQDYHDNWHNEANTANAGNVAYRNSVRHCVGTARGEVGRVDISTVVPSVHYQRRLRPLD